MNIWAVSLFKIKILIYIQNKNEYTCTNIPVVIVTSIECKQKHSWDKNLSIVVQQLYKCKANNWPPSIHRCEPKITSKEIKN